MNLNSLFTAYRRSLLAGVLAWCCAPAFTYAADDYLSILEAEADNTGRATEVTAEEAGHDGQERTEFGSSTFITPGLDFDEFEAVLARQYSGSHFLYIRLSEQNRQQVYRSYQDDNQISIVREEIVRLLSAE